MAEEEANHVDPVPLEDINLSSAASVSSANSQNHSETQSSLVDNEEELEENNVDRVTSWMKSAEPTSTPALSAPSKFIRLMITIVDGDKTTLVIGVHKTDTIKTVKAKVAELMNTKAKNIALHWERGPLTDLGKTVENLGMIDQTNIRLTSLRRPETRPCECACAPDCPCDVMHCPCPPCCNEVTFQVIAGFNRTFDDHQCCPNHAAGTSNDWMGSNWFVVGCICVMLPLLVVGIVLGSVALGNRLYIWEGPSLGAIWCLGIAVGQCLFFGVCWRMCLQMRHLVYGFDEYRDEDEEEDGKMEDKEVGADAV